MLVEWQKLVTLQWLLCIPNILINVKVLDSILASSSSISTVCMLSYVWLCDHAQTCDFVIPWTVAYQAPLSMESFLINRFLINWFSSVQFSSVTQSCPTLWDPINRSTPGLLVHQQLPEFTQTHVHRVRDAIQPFHPLSSPSPPAPNPSQHQSLFQWVNSSHEVAKVLEFQL